jgi:hypothetical protein
MTVGPTPRHDLEHGACPHGLARAKYADWDVGVARKLLRQRVGKGARGLRHSRAWPDFDPAQRVPFPSTSQKPRADVQLANVVLRARTVRPRRKGELAPHH